MKRQPRAAVTEPSYGKGPLSSVLMVVAFAGLMVLGWFAFEEAKNTLSEQSLPLIKSNPEPYKIKPQDPGGMEIPFREKQVFNTVSGKTEKEISQETEKSVRLLPPPEEPLSVDEIKSTQVKELPDDVKKLLSEETGIMLDKYRVSSPSASEDTSLKIITKQQKLTVKSVPEATMISTEQPSAIIRPLVEYSKITGNKRVALVAIPDKPSAYEQLRQPQYTPELVNSAEKINVISGVKVQLGAFRSVESLQKNWNDLKEKYYNLLRGLDYGIQKVDLGAKGIFYRLQAGPFDKEATADKLCKSLKSKRVGCFVVR